ncbi:hypothetical protein TNCV_525521 [Trichonephila clavipes]|nr:hypothetical protein TNCV_525521 [Trichonephila clavipes]
MHVFLLTRNENRLTRKDFSSGNDQNTENNGRIGLAYCIIGRIRCSDVCATPITADKDILEFVQDSKNIIDPDSRDENEMNNAAPRKKNLNGCVTICTTLLARRSNPSPKGFAEIVPFLDSMITEGEKGITFENIVRKRAYCETENLLPPPLNRN